MDPEVKVFHPAPPKLTQRLEQGTELAESAKGSWAHCALVSCYNCP